MKLYGAPMPAPNPRRVRMFLAEKGIALAETPLDLRKREHKADEFRAKNPLGQVPTLELEDGTVITETVSICRYFEETQPDPPLFGKTAVEKAQIDMWCRRVEFQLTIPVGMFWRHAHPFTASLLTQFKDFGESNREHVAGGYRFFDRALKDRDFLAGGDISMADLCLLSTVDFATWIGLEAPADLANLAAWRERINARPSSRA